MLKGLAFLLIACLTGTQVQAQTVVALQQGAYDSDAQAYFNTVQSVCSVTPTPAFMRAVSNYVVAEKAAGNWGGQDEEGIGATTNSCVASINLAQPGLYTITWSGSPAFAVQTGLNGDGATVYGDTGVNVNALVRLSQNNAHLEAWASVGHGAPIGTLTGTSFRINMLLNKLTQLVSNTAITDTGGGVSGLNYGDRTTSATINTGANGAAQTTGGSAVSAARNAVHVVICQNNGTFCTSGINELFWGFGQAMPNESAHYTNVRNLLLALGVTGI